MAALAPGVMSADEAALWSALRIDRDDAARQHLFERHAGFARSIARRQFNGRSQGDLEFQDVHQWACTGLLEAIDRFDPTRGVAFRTYAAHRISGSISNGISTMSEVREQQSARARVRRDRLRSLAPGDVVGLSDADALQSLAAIAMGLAVGFMLEGTRLYVEDEEETIVSRDQANGYDSAAWYELTERLLVEIESLPSRER
ncbi:MAG TPA: sigma-70 family RNA polymerase sigma factor, partial [Acetobacteraceae bacterium]|nr:sigma-70 family RNA polymerase sigma factor [Acetobacteraceae bacterium]